MSVWDYGWRLDCYEASQGLSTSEELMNQCLGHYNIIISTLNALWTDLGPEGTGKPRSSRNPRHSRSPPLHRWTASRDPLDIWNPSGTHTDIHLAAIKNNTSVVILSFCAPLIFREKHSENKTKQHKIILGVENPEHFSSVDAMLLLQKQSYKTYNVSKNVGQNFWKIEHRFFLTVSNFVVNKRNIYIF